MCLPSALSSAVTVIPPSPTNRTSSPLFTIERSGLGTVEVAGSVTVEVAESALPAVSFQPKPFNMVDKFPALTGFLLFFSLGASGTITLPSLTLRSTVSTLNLAERPVWSIVTPSPSTK